MIQHCNMIHRLAPLVQQYPWGSAEHIPRFLGLDNPTHEPWAELWMGAHPKAPSRLIGHKENLLQWIETDPERVLGKKILERYGTNLPFLFKLLAAAEPLSIQCHPNREQAEEGFKRENHAGIPLDSPQRNYRDSNHKPEILLAILPCTALCGFRPVSESCRMFEKILPSVPLLEKPVELLKEGKLKDFFSAFFTLPRLEIGECIQRVRDQLKEYGGTDTGGSDQNGDEAGIEASEGNTGVLSSEEDIAYWFLQLSSRYPDDPGSFAPFYLNLIRLEPNEALYLGAGVLHGYLEGFGVELMANSDNVLRGGLTSKHVDLEELLRVVQFSPQEPNIILPRRKKLKTWKGEGWEDLYPTPASEFLLSVLRFQDVERGEAPLHALMPGPQILLCGEGAIQIQGESRSVKGGEKKSVSVEVKKGDSVFVEAAVENCLISGTGVLYRAQGGG